MPNRKRSDAKKKRSDEQLMLRNPPALTDVRTKLSAEVARHLKTSHKY